FWSSFCRLPSPATGGTSRAGPRSGGFYGKAVFRAENLAEIPRWAFHSHPSQWRVVRNVIHCPWPEALEATLVVDRVAEHLCVVDHRSYDAAICRFGERVRPVIDHLRSSSIRKPVVSQCVGRVLAKHLAEVIEGRPGGRRPERKE